MFQNHVDISVHGIDKCEDVLMKFGGIYSSGKAFFKNSVSKYTNEKSMRLKWCQRIHFGGWVDSVNNVRS